MSTGFLTTREVAQELKVTRDTVQAYCKRGLLPGAVRVSPKSPWRIPPAALKALEPDPAVVLPPRNARSAAQQGRRRAA